MANTVSAKKMTRKIEKRTAVNRSRRSRMRTFVRKVEEAIAAGNQARIIGDPRQGAQTMTGYIAQAATGENAPGSLAFNTLYAVGLTLFVLTLLINMISIRLVRRFREAY